uniref:Uncharacterized protein n=1 Tax=Pseudomonas phage RVTF4 TaxID=3236931 RepID=A0AB39CCI1_9VIRU
MALSAGLIDRLRGRAAKQRGMTEEQFRSYGRGRMVALNGQLEAQMKAQRMTPEVLEKRCTL